jgi:hypothetical protein
MGNFVNNLNDKSTDSSSGSYLKQKVTREVDIPDTLQACDNVPKLDQCWLPDKD